MFWAGGPDWCDARLKQSVATRYLPSVGNEQRLGERWRGVLHPLHPCMCVVRLHVQQDGKEEGEAPNPARPSCG